MRKRAVIFAVIAVLVMCCANTALAYWIWTPETKKFVNPKLAPKDSPKEQFDWAMSFYNAKDFKRSATEFEKVTKYYEYSEYASKAQYYVGLSYENMEKFYTAFQSYQKAIDNFPHIENLDEIIAREFNIGKLYASKDNPKILGTDIMTSLDRAVEIFRKVVDNAPYGPLADEAQFDMGEALKRAERYEEAVQAFQKLVDDYPGSRFGEKGRFEVAECAYKASLKPAYDSTATDKAIQAFQDFSQANRDPSLTVEADKTIQRLRDKMAEKSLITADFYEKQKHYRSAIVYYQDVVDRFPDCSYVDKAKAKIEGLKKKMAGETGGGDKKAWKPLNFPKPVKQPKIMAPAEEEAKSPKKRWNPFSFIKPAKEESAKAETAPVTEKPRKTWKPFSFTKPAKEEPAESTVIESAPAPEKPKSAWKPISFDKSEKEETVESITVIQAEPESASVTEKPKSAWKPFSFTGKPKTEEKAEESAPVAEITKERPVKKAWKPLSFDKSTEEESAESTVIESAPAPEKPKSTWKPFSFTGKPKTEEKAEESAPVAEITKERPVKKAWKPLSFDKSEKEETVESITVIQAEPESAPVTEKPKSTWKPLDFTGKPKKEEPTELAAPVAETAEEKPAKKAWKPLSFDKSEKEETVESITVIQAEPESAPAPEKPKSTWKPLDFTGKPKTEESSKGWTPLNFSKP